MGIGELLLVDIGAVVLDVSAVEDVVVLVDIAHAHAPVVRLLRPLRIRVVAGVAGKPRAQVEEDAVGNGVLVVVSVVGQRDLPPQAAVAVLAVPPRRLGVEHGLRQREPLRIFGGRVLEVILGGDHGRHPPEALVVVAQGRGPVGWHVAVLWRAGLEDQRVFRHVVVRRVVRVVPVVDVRPPHCTRLPPVVRPGWRRPWKNARCLARLVSFVVGKEVRRDDLGRRLDRVCENVRCCCPAKNPCGDFAQGLPRTLAALNCAEGGLPVEVRSTSSWPRHVAQLAATHSSEYFIVSSQRRLLSSGCQARTIDVE